MWTIGRQSHTVPRPTAGMAVWQSKDCGRAGFVALCPMWPLASRRIIYCGSLGRKRVRSVTMPTMWRLTRGTEGLPGHPVKIPQTLAGPHCSEHSGTQYIPSCRLLIAVQRLSGANFILWGTLNTIFIQRLVLPFHLFTEHFCWVLVQIKTFWLG